MSFLACIFILMLLCSSGSDKKPENKNNMCSNCDKRPKIKTKKVPQYNSAGTFIGFETIEYENEIVEMYNSAGTFIGYKGI